VHDNWELLQLVQLLLYALHIGYEKRRVVAAMVDICILSRLLDSRGMEPQ
jgi:hypothetical protein